MNLGITWVKERVGEREVRQPKERGLRGIWLLAIRSLSSCGKGLPVDKKTEKDNVYL